VHHGGGSSAKLVELARTIRDGVLGQFGVHLHPEPVLLGLAF
jgi:UDP-N-acetylmuramate dehydrogenase